MKTIGLIGGMSWESTLSYYRIINESVKRELGGFHSAKLLLYSVDFAEIEKYQSDGDWDKSAEAMSQAAMALERAGADYIVICANTMHKVVPQMERHIGIPVLHIAEVTADCLIDSHIHTAALLGTRYTMTQDFYRDKLTQAGIRVLIPCLADVELVNSVIYNELCLGIISESSRRECLRIIDSLAEQGARGVILGCTELGLLIDQKDTALPVFDTTLIHAQKAALAAI